MRPGKVNVGYELETCVMLELHRRGAEVSYVHTPGGYEVYFLARYPAGREELIQVCTSLDDSATRERETWALLEAGRQHRRASMHLISLDIPTVSGTPSGVIVHAARDWLLREDRG